MRSLKKILLPFLLVWWFAAHGNILPPGGLLYPGQTVFSSNGRYFVVMQTDGNFVMYRTDGVVRFASYRFGYFTAMQTDGNLVEYNHANQALWHTSTWGNPGSYLAVQDDGNLVVYSPGGQALWNIGADQAPIDGPTNAADVVARDLDYPGLGALGHLGIWTGGEVIEIVNQGGNAVRYSSWDAFRNASKLWPTARPNVPNHLIYYCFNAYCNIGNYPGIAARSAIIQRANQVRLIGADYTLAAQWRTAWPAEPGYPAQRGLYRCDTFVADAFTFSAGSNKGNYVPVYWQTRMDQLTWGVITPTSIWNKLKN